MNDGSYARQVFLLIRRIEIREMQRRLPYAITVDPGDDIICDRCNGDIDDEPIVIIGGNALCTPCREKMHG